MSRYYRIEQDGLHIRIESVSFTGTVKQNEFVANGEEFVYDDGVGKEKVVARAQFNNRVLVLRSQVRMPCASW